MATGPSVDLLALLRPAQVTVYAFGSAWTLQASTARDWLGALAFDIVDLSGIFPGLLHDDDIDAMTQVMLECDDINLRWTNTARVALGRAAGRDWWWAYNLSKRALEGWQYINGMLLLEGVTPGELSYPDWLDVVYMMLYRNADEKGRIKFDTSLQIPPRGVTVRQSAVARKAALAAFAAD